LAQPAGGTYWRTVWTLLKKLKIDLSHEPAIPLLGIFPEKSVVQNDFLISLLCLCKVDINTILDFCIMVERVPVF